MTNRTSIATRRSPEPGQENALRSAQIEVQTGAAIVAAAAGLAAVAAEVVVAVVPDVADAAASVAVTAAADTKQVWLCGAGALARASQSPNNSFTEMAASKIAAVFFGAKHVGSAVPPARRAKRRRRVSLSHGQERNRIPKTNRQLSDMDQRIHAAVVCINCSFCVESLLTAVMLPVEPSNPGGVGLDDDPAKPYRFGGWIFTSICSRLMKCTAKQAAGAVPRSREPALTLPSSTRSRTSGQENPAHDHDPHDADDGRDEPRISAAR